MTTLRVLTTVESEAVSLVDVEGQPFPVQPQDVNIPSGPTGPSQNTVTLVNGLNSNIPVAEFSSLRFIGPTAAFSVGGLAPTAPAAGDVRVIVNTTGQTMTLVNEDASSTAANRIHTQTGANVILETRQSSATLLYDGTINRWVVQNAGVAQARTVDVRDMGADPTGAADSATAIAAAVAAAGTDGVVLFPAIPGGALYIVSTAIAVPAGVSLVGDDRESVEVAFFGGTNGFVWGPSGSYHAQAGVCVGMTISGIGTGLTGLTVQGTEAAKLDRLFFAGWTQQAMYFLDTNLTSLARARVSACGGATFGQVEIDGLGWLSGGGSTNFSWDSCIVENGNVGVLCGVRIDRSTNVHLVHGGVENTGTPIIVSGRTVTDADGNGTNDVVLESLDVEFPSGAAVSFIDFGYGLPDGGVIAVCTSPIVKDCLLFASGSTLGVKAIRFAHTVASRVEQTGIAQGGAAVVAGVWYEGTTNTFQSLGVNGPDVQSNPYVAINGTVLVTPTWFSPWDWTDVPADVAVAGADVTLPFQDYAAKTIVLTGILTANIHIIFPIAPGKQWVLDATGVTFGGHTITARANGVDWSTTIDGAHLFSLTYGGTGKLYGATLAA